MKGWSLVDTETYEWAKEYRWSIDRGGYFFRGRWLADEQRHSPIRLHREILGLENGEPIEVDHVNRDRTDNRRFNLRTCTRKQNAQNVPARGGTSKHRGVTRCNIRGWQRWTAKVQIDGRSHTVGYFETEEEAAEAAAKFRAEHMTHSEEE